MKRRQSDRFATIRTEGLLLPPEVLQRIQSLDQSLDGLQPTAYGLAETDRLREAIERSWTVVQKHWRAFQIARGKVGDHDETGTVVTNDKWLIPLFQELGYGRLGAAGKARVIDDDTYPVSRFWKGEGEHEIPIHTVGFKVNLDQRTKGVRGAAQLSPYGLVQQYLNKVDESLWAFVSNGLRLRILRDNLTLSRLSQVEFDLEAMMEAEAYSDFAILWLCCHVTSVAAEKPEQCRLEQWCRAGESTGTRVLEHLKVGVEQAIQSLGQGFLSHRDNDQLRSRLRSGELTTLDLYRQLLREVYRLLFLCVAEDRDLLHAPDASPAVRELYERHYSIRRLREMAESIRGGKHADLWDGLSTVFAYLDHPDGCPALGLPGLGSFLWSPASTPDLNGPAPAGAEPVPHPASISNEHLLDAIRALAFIEENKVLRPVDYRNLGSEELGSVYEGLLELVPRVHLDATEGEDVFQFGSAAGNERKTSGSYYTPDSLVQLLLDSALDPVIDDRLAGKQGDDAEAALLGITVCDPAVGSGHFLIQAAHRLAKRLAEIRTGEPEPSVEAYQRALRDTIRHCVYGVDMNPMSAELCKVALWMESLDPGRPLSFLDHHIQVGNSLIGCTPDLLAKGLPDDAFKTIEGDEKKPAAALKSRNKAERKDRKKGQELIAFGTEDAGALSDRAAGLDAVTDDDLSSVRAKADRYAELRQDPLWRRRKLASDAWCAAFVWRKDGGELSDQCPTDADVQLMLTDSDYAARNPEQVAEIDRLARRYQFFHWSLAFPQIMSPAATHDGAAPSGFAAMLGNPPWERVKLQEKEWFATRHAAIAKASNGSKRKKLIKGLEAEDPPLHAAFLDACRVAEGNSHFLRDSGRYPLCGRGDVNTYTVFAELFRDSLSPRGRSGCLVPSGIATDDTTKFFFQSIVEDKSLITFWHFENRLALFPDVGKMITFAAMTLGGSSNAEESPRFGFFLLEPSHAFDRAATFTLSNEDFSLINPNTRTCPIFRTARDARITREIHRRIPVIAKECSKKAVLEPRAKFSTMFHMTNDSGRFATPADLEPSGFCRIEDRYLSEDCSYLPLYEGKYLATSFDRDFMSPTDNPPIRFWVNASEVKSAPQSHLCVYRWVTRSIDERTVHAGLIPYSAVGNSLAIIESANANYLTAALTSFACDYVVRQKIGGPNLTFGLIKQVPVPQQGSSSLFPSLLEAFSELSLISTSLLQSPDEFPFRYSLPRRFQIRCELDAAFFHLYGIERDDVDYIMGTFPIVKRKDEEKYGHYRTKDRILQIYDEMAECMAKGEEWQSPLEPPPGDPRACWTEDEMDMWRRGEGEPLIEKYKLLDEELVDSSATGP